MFARFFMRGALVLTLLVVWGSAVFADESPSGWYVMPSYHQTGLDNANGTYSQPSGQTPFDTSYGDDTHPGLALGYAFDGPFRIDVQYKNHKNDLKGFGLGLQSSRLESSTLVVNLWRDFGPWRRLRPYAGIGIGGGNLKLDQLDGDFLLGQLGAGIEWRFVPKAAVDLGYRYQRAFSDPQLKGNSQKLTTEYAAGSVQLGIRFDFRGS